MKLTKQLKTVLIFVGLLIIIAMLDKPDSFFIAPTCIVKDDCWEPLQDGFCGVRYDCIQGRCYSEQVRCVEDCGNGIDDDSDGLVDCNDDDCWHSNVCPCSSMLFKDCRPGRCFCPESQTPKWFTGEGCECTG